MLKRLTTTFLSKLKQLEKPQRLDWTLCGTIFFLSMFFCWLLSLAYPEGLVNEETPTYWLIQKDFHWFASNQLDWYRTIPYGALLGFASMFKNPTGVLYWVNSLIFSMDCALVFVLGRMLFASHKLALALAASTLLFEVASMRTFYNNLGVSTDAMFGELITLGVLLILVGWLGKKWRLLLLGYFVFGLVAFIKPAGTSVWLIWLPFAIVVFTNSQTTTR